MKKNRIKIGITLLCVLSCAITSIAQEGQDCAIVLKEAEKSYEEGKLEEIPSILKSCLEVGFSPDQKIQAYRLLTMTYLFDDKKNLANESIQNLLKIDPEYVVNPALDPAELIYLLDSYQTLPKFSIGFIAGTNFSKVAPTEAYGIDNTFNDPENVSSGILSTAGPETSPNEPHWKYSPGGIGFHGGIVGSYMLFRNLNLHIEPSYYFTKFTYTKNYTLNEFTNTSDSLNNLGNLELNETHGWIQIPLNLTYDIKLSPKLNSFVRLGGTYGRLLNAGGTFTREYPQSASLAPVTGPQEDLKLHRNTSNYWITGGVGLKYKIKKGVLFVDVRYQYGMQNMVNAAQRYSNTTLLYKYNYVDDNFNLDNLAISIGAAKSFYKPKKKNQ